MSEKIFCEKCGAEMSSYINGSSCGMECKSCGWGWATTYRSPIEEDDTDYALTISSVSNPSLTTIKCISNILMCNFVTAKEKLKNDIVIIGKASTIEKYIKTLISNSIIFMVSPNFPY